MKKDLFVRLRRIKWMYLYFCMGLGGIVFLNGCTEDYFPGQFSVDENLKALLSTRSVAVTVCSDAYVEAGGYSEYKGTTCRTFVGGGEGLGSGQYYPGGFPQNGSATDTGSGAGGGRTFYVGDNWHFEFKNMSRLYGYGSTLDLVGKSHLEAVFSIQKTMPQDFDKLVDRLVRRHLRIFLII